jgi:hypothetical protein
LDAVAGRLLGPQRFDQLVDRHRIGHAQGEHGEERALLCALELNNAVARPHHERAKELDVDIRAHSGSGHASPRARHQQEANSDHAP